MGRRWFEEQRRRAEGKGDSVGNVREEDQDYAKREGMRKNSGEQMLYYDDGDE